MLIQNLIDADALKQLMIEIKNADALKVDKVLNMGLIDTTKVTKLDGISTGANKVEPSATNGNIKIDGVEKVVYTHPAGTNPHGTTKSDIGLPAVDNTSDANKPVSTAQAAALALKADKTYVDTQIGSVYKYKGSVATYSALPSTGNTIGDVWNVVTGATVELNSMNYVWTGTIWDPLAGTVDMSAYSNTATNDAKYVAKVAGKSVVADTEITRLAGMSTGATKAAVSTTNGNILIDAVEKVVYTHPAAHAATMITEDATHRFATDAEKATWNAKAGTAVATRTVAGLMSAADKTKLDDINIVIATPAEITSWFALA